MTKKDSIKSVSDLLLQGKQDKAMEKFDQGFPDDETARDIVSDYNLNRRNWLETEILREEYDRNNKKIINRLKDFMKEYHNSVHNLVYIFSNPRDKTQLNFQDELKAIQDALLTKGPFKISDPEIVPAITKEEFFSVIRDTNPDLLHVSMHGDREKGFYFLDKDRKECIVTGQELYNDIQAAVNFANVSMECVLLSCCNSSDHAKELSKLVPFVIGMDGPIRVQAANLFAKEFYENLALSGDYKKSFDAGIYKLGKDDLLKDMATFPKLFSKTA